MGEIPRSDEIIRNEDMGKTVIEGDPDSEISRRFFDLAEMLLQKRGGCMKRDAYYSYSKRTSGSRQR